MGPRGTTIERREGDLVGEPTDEDRVHTKGPPQGTHKGASGSGHNGSHRPGPRSEEGKSRPHSGESSSGRGSRGLRDG